MTWGQRRVPFETRILEILDDHTVAQLGVRNRRTKLGFSTILQEELQEGIADLETIFEAAASRGGAGEKRRLTFTMQVRTQGGQLNALTG